VRDDEIRSRLTEANPWWRAAAGGDPTGWAGADTLLKAKRESEIGYRAKILDDIPEHVLSGALVLLQGPRRVGKSVAVRELAVTLLKRPEIDPRQVVAFSCDAMSAQDFTRAFRLGRELTRTVDRQGARRRVWMIDEVGQIRGWSARLKALRDGTDVGEDTVIATSSSWRQEEDVQGNLLAGRAGTSGLRRVRLLLPMSFRDYLHSARPKLGVPAVRDVADLQSVAVADDLEALRFDIDDYDLAWQEYLTCGGFPRSVAHAQRLPGFDMAFVRDLAAYLRADVDRDAPPESLPRLIDGLVSRSTSPLNLAKAYAELGYRSRDICERRINRIVNAYGAFWSTRRADNGRAVPGSQSKLYLTDPLLAWLPSLVRSGLPAPNFTALTEQVLGLALARAIESAEEGRWLGGDTIGFARTENDNEIDFCPVPLPGSSRWTTPIESKWSPDGWRADSRVIVGKYGRGIVATKASLDTSGPVWGVPAPLLALLIG
jgi:predicted AAA+ superfamily ATPase